MTKEAVAEILLDIGAVKIQPDEPFTWASGIISPIYCDNRKIIGDVDARRLIANFFAEKVRAADAGVDVIAGTSTAGIPHAAFVSEQLEKPMCYVRGKKKTHGTGGQIEGADVDGRTVVLIEDLISTGGSSIEAAEALQDAGADVVMILAIFTYNIGKSFDSFDSLGLNVVTLSDIDTLLEASIKSGDLDEAARSEVVAFRNRL